MASTTTDAGNPLSLMSLDEVSERLDDFDAGDEGDEGVPELSLPEEEDSALFEDEEVGDTACLGPEGIQDLPEDIPVPAAVVALVPPEAGGPPPAKRPRGRPRKSAPAVGAPPKRPSTPPPVISDSERAQFKIRSADRKAALLALVKRKDRLQEMMDLLVKDEEDRHNCCGDWKWEGFTEDTPLINNTGVFTRGGDNAKGLSSAAEKATTTLDLLRLFLTEPVLANIVQQTNRYARQERAKEGSSKEAWQPVTREEIMAFIGVAIAMSINQKGDVREYWSTLPLLESPWFPSVMSSRRFRMIQRYVHLADSTRAPRTADGKLCDRLYEVRPLLDAFLTSFPQHYHPGQNLSLDEQMLGTKARCSFIQVMKDKPTKRGVKLWVLCDAQVRYCLNFQVYTGGTGEKGLSFRVVNELMTPYLGRNHHLYTDNFYTSPELLAHLLSHNTLAVGTVRQDRLHMPMRMRTSVRDFEVSESSFLSSHKMTACRWKDKRDVFCLSTVHGNAMRTITRRKRGTRGELEEVQKPAMICDYNTHMGGVDVYDQLLSYHPVPRRYKRWPTKVFWRLIEMALLNAYALWQLKQEGPIPVKSHKLFRVQLAEELVAPHRESFTLPSRIPGVPSRLKHFNDPIIFSGSTKRCVVCKNGNRKTSQGCVNCGEDIRLHFSPNDGRPSCFLLFHTKHDYATAYAKTH